MDEFVVRGGLVYDGTGAPPAQADVWVRDGEIMAVGVDAGGSDIPAVDASGCVVTPLRGHSPPLRRRAPAGRGFRPGGVSTGHYLRAGR